MPDILTLVGHVNVCICGPNGNTDNMPAKLKFCIEKEDIGSTTEKVWSPKLAIRKLREVEPVMWVQIIDILNNPPNEPRNSEIKVLNKFDKLLPCLQTLY